MRTAFISELMAQAEANPRIFLVVGDLGFSVVEPFAARFPDRFLNAGVAEQNMTGVAAGLASEGYHVFTYSIANFPTFRCAEQIRNDVAYHNVPVTIVCVGGGLAYGSLGYSHHAVQDLALIRTFPGMTIAAPGDPFETRAAVEYLCCNPGPSYLRIGKAGEPCVHQVAVKCRPGRVQYSQRERRPGLVLTTGGTLKIAAAAITPANLAFWEVASVPIWGGRYGLQLVEDLAQHRWIVTVEDHLRAGGFGSYIYELIAAARLSVQCRCLALDESIVGEVASQAELTRRGGIDVPAIIGEMSNVVRKTGG